MTHLLVVDDEVSILELIKNSLGKDAKRDIWTADMIRLALDKCMDSKLYVAMNLSFACSLRMGEILGLTWENVHISDEDNAADNAYVYIDKELTRASKRAIETLGEKDIYYIFTPQGVSGNAPPDTVQ